MWESEHELAIPELKTSEEAHPETAWDRADGGLELHKLVKNCVGDYKDKDAPDDADDPVDTEVKRTYLPKDVQSESLLLSEDFSGDTQLAYRGAIVQSMRINFDGLDLARVQFQGQGYASRYSVGVRTSSYADRAAGPPEVPAKVTIAGDDRDKIGIGCVVRGEWAAGNFQAIVTDIQKNAARANTYTVYFDKNIPPSVNYRPGANLKSALPTDVQFADTPPFGTLGGVRFKETDSDLFDCDFGSVGVYAGQEVRNRTYGRATPLGILSERNRVVDCTFRTLFSTNDIERMGRAVSTDSEKVWICIGEFGKPNILITLSEVTWSEASPVPDSDDVLYMDLVGACTGSKPLSEIRIKLGAITEAEFKALT